LLSACSSEPDGTIPAVTVPVEAMSYNLANRLGQPEGEPIAERLANATADFVAVQEANDPDWLLERLADSYELTEAPQSGVGLIYDASRWELRDQGAIALGGDDDGWGQRVAMWGLFVDAELGGIYVYSTHWCVTIRTPDDACDEQRQLAYADRILDHLDDSLPSVIAGDLNVFDGFESGPVISHLRDQGLIDAFRSVKPSEDGTTFVGNDWAPAGRLDYIFATEPADVLDANIERDTPGGADASDHFAVTATMAF
jgi:endonuclease/exonuclease/phosphatase family metal-dependent hydrolase